MGSGFRVQVSGFRVHLHLHGAVLLERRREALDKPRSLVKRRLDALRPELAPVVVREVGRGLKLGAADRHAGSARLRLDFRFKASGLISGLKFWVSDGFKVSGLTFRVWDSGFKIQGSGLGVQDTRVPPA